MFISITFRHFKQQGFNSRTFSGVLVAFFSVWFKAFIIYVIPIYIFYNVLFLGIMDFLNIYNKPISFFESFFLSLACEGVYMLVLFFPFLLEFIFETQRRLSNNFFIKKKIYNKKKARIFWEYKKIKR